MRTRRARALANGVPRVSLCVSKWCSCVANVVQLRSLRVSVSSVCVSVCFSVFLCVLCLSVCLSRRLAHRLPLPRRLAPRVPLPRRLFRIVSRCFALSHVVRVSVCSWVTWIGFLRSHGFLYESRKTTPPTSLSPIGWCYGYFIGGWGSGSNREIV